MNIVPLACCAVSLGIRCVCLRLSSPHLWLCLLSARTCVRVTGWVAVSCNLTVRSQADSRAIREVSLHVCNTHTATARRLTTATHIAETSRSKRFPLTFHATGTPATPPLFQEMIVRCEHDCVVGEHVAHATSPLTFRKNAGALRSLHHHFVGESSERVSMSRSAPAHEGDKRCMARWTCG